MGEKLVFITKVGKKGVVVLPKKIRELFGIKEKCLVVVETREDGIFIRPLYVVRVKSTAEARRVFEESLEEEYRIEEEADRIVKQD